MLFVHVRRATPADFGGPYLTARLGAARRGSKGDRTFLRRRLGLGLSEDLPDIFQVDANASGNPNDIGVADSGGGRGSGTTTALEPWLADAAAASWMSLSPASPDGDLEAGADTRPLLSST
jgi:hypothetical protein